MSKLGKLAKKIGETPIARISQTKGGLFAGRVLPKDRITDANWTALLELEKPPEDGLYIPRDHVKDVEKQAAAEKKKQKSLPVRTLYNLVQAAVEYDAKQKGKKVKKPKVEVKNDTQLAKSGGKVPIPEDWNTLSPDSEATLLGLEQLRRGESLTIIGAGISGLTLAWLLSRSRPDIQISILEAKGDVGGWMDSTTVKMPDGSEQIFESGPRTMLPSHPGTQVTLNILAEIGKLGELVGGVPRSSPTNRKGLLYDNKIVELPQGLGEAARFLTTSPILKGARLRALKDLWVPARSSNVDDESVYSFFSRRLGPKLADRMLSALMRGIYGGNVKELSARSVARLNKLFYLERSEKMSILGAAFSGSLKYLDEYASRAIPLLYKAMVAPSAPIVEVGRSVSLLGFPRTGIQGIARAMYDDLKSSGNVDIQLNTKVESVKLSANSTKVSAKIAGTDNHVTSNVLISTIANANMFTQKPALKDEMAQIAYNSLAVVNVWTPEPVAKDWFGILVPSTENAHNPEGLLGIIFDSSVRNAMQPVVKDAEPFETSEGSSMTVMIGGDLWPEGGLTKEEAEKRALDGLQKILGPFDASKATARATIQTRCIPQYTVGHSARAQQIHQDISNAYLNRVGIIGTALGRGVGVSDCVADALVVATRFSEQRKLLHPEYFFGQWYSITRPEYFN